MAFAKDRDLLALEPGLLREAAWSGQRLVSATDAAVSGTVLTSPSSDLEAAQVEAGHVAQVEGVPLEVTARLSPTQASVSLMRATPEASPIPPTPATDASLAVYTFAPQIEQIHRELLRAVDVDPDGGEGTVDQSAVLNPEAVARVESLGALYLIYASAAMKADASSPLGVKARLYAERFARAREALRVELDLDGDGTSDASRAARMTQMVRA